MKDNILVSYVVPSYNTGRWIEETLCSIQEQKISQYEVVIVDDGSTDETSQRVRPFLSDDRFRYISFSKNQGIGRAMVFNRAQCRGEYICAIAADDSLKANHTTIGLELLEKYPEACIATAGLEPMDENGQPRQDLGSAGTLPELPPYIPGREALEMSLQHNIVCGPGAIFRAALTRLILPYLCGNWRVANDWLSVILHFATGFGLVSHRENTVRYRIHEKSLSQSSHIRDVRDAEIRLVPLAALAQAKHFSRDAAELWQRYGNDLYNLWLRRAVKLAIAGKSDRSLIRLGREYFYGGRPQYTPFLAEVGFRLLGIIATSLREKTASQHQSFPCAGLRAIDHVVFKTAYGK